MGFRGVGRKRGYIIGKDIQVAVLENEWVESLHNPDDTYCYVEKDYISYLVTPKFNDTGWNGMPHKWDTFDEIERIGGWKKILKEQKKLAPNTIQS